MAGSIPLVELRDIVTQADREAALSLHTTKAQEAFVATVEQSFKDAEDYPEARARHWSAHDGDTMIGFVMISDGIPDDVLEADPTLVGPYFLWRLLIDERYQRQAYGTAVIDRVVDYVRSRGGDHLLVSYSAGEGNPGPFYARYGFVETDRVVEGERVLRLDLR